MSFVMYSEVKGSMFSNMTKKECNRLKLKYSVNHIDFTFEEAISEAENFLKRKLVDLKSQLELAHENYDAAAYDSDGLMNDSHEVEETLSLVFDLESDIDMNEQQLYCFSEMKIVHLFRAYEITLKKVIKTALPSENEKDFFNWEKLREFCKRNGFDIKSVPSYLEIDQLRLVNNSIKHSSNIDPRVKKNVPQFSDETEFSYATLSRFYSSVREHLLPFLQGIAKGLESHIYDYSEEKINKIVDEYREVMDSSELKLLSERINQAAVNDKVSPLESLSIFAVAKKRT